jgi:hypothetical protein
MRKRFIAFFSAAGKWGISLMTGGLISWMCAAYEHVAGRSIPSFWWAVLGFVLFMLGAFLAWNDEHSKFIAEKERNERPNFLLQVENLIPFYNQNVNITVLCFSADITNYGSPSQARGWLLKYQSPTIEQTVQNKSLHQERVVFPVAGGVNLVLKRPDMLPARTLNAIEKGHTKHGRIIFELAGDKKREVESGAAKMWLICNDIFGNPYQAYFEAGPKTACEELTPYPDEETEKYSSAPNMPKPPSQP